MTYASSSNLNLVPEAITNRTKEHLKFLYYPLRDHAQVLLSEFYKKTKRILTITESLRSMSDQMTLYQKGRVCENGVWKVVDARKIVTNARPGMSWHCYGLAFDCAFTGMDPYLKKETQPTRTSLWQIYGDIGKSLGLHWGGDFKLVNGVSDLPHFENTFGLRLDQAMEIYQKGDVHEIWKYLDLNQ